MPIHPSSGCKWRTRRVISPVPNAHLMRRLAVLLLTTVAFAMVVASPGRTSPPAAHIIDMAGDANLANGHGLHDTGEGVDSRPASLDVADLREIRFGTAYETIVDRDDTGRATRVRHIPTALNIHVTTEGTFVQQPPVSLTFRVPMLAGECPLVFQLSLPGPEGGPLHRQGAEVQNQSAERCGTTQPSWSEGEGVTYALAGKTATMRVPLATMGGLLGDQTDLQPSDRAHVKRTMHVTIGIAFDAYRIQGAMFDIAPLGRGFVIGSDVPPDVDCLAESEDPRCA